MWHSSFGPPCPFNIANAQLANSDGNKKLRDDRDGHGSGGTVDGNQKSGDHQLRLVVYPIIYRVYTSQVSLFGISSINSMFSKKII